MAIGLDPAASPEGVAGSSVRREPAVPASAASTRRAPVVRFFGSVFLSLYGDWLTTVALVVLLYELTGTPAGPAGYLLARVAPRVIGPWIGGSLADRLSPRRVMIYAGLIQSGFTASLVFADRAHSVWALYAAVALAQFVGSLARPSQGALLPALVADRGLTQANALYGTFFSTSIFVGPAIGAVLLVHTGPDVLFLIDAGTFAVASLLAATLPSGRVASPPGSVVPRIPSPSTFRMAMRDPSLRLIAAASLALGLTPTVAQAVLVVAARERLGSDAAVGIFYSAVGAGGTLGGLLAFRWRPPFNHLRLALFCAAIVQFVGLAAFAAVAGRVPGLIVLATSTFASAAFDVWAITEIQRRAPVGYMGRFNAILWASQYAGMLVGALWALGTTAIFHWDLALELSCLAMAILVGIVGITGNDRSTLTTRERDAEVPVAGLV
ncbi:MAG: MFS transporter [Candidatus Dormibacter sp.]